jgi:hypothetical protein
MRARSVAAADGGATFADVAVIPGGGAALSSSRTLHGSDLRLVVDRRRRTQIFDLPPFQLPDSNWFLRLRDSLHVVGPATGSDASTFEVYVAAVVTHYRTGEFGEVVWHSRDGGRTWSVSRIP